MKIFFLFFGSEKNNLPDKSKFMATVSNFNNNFNKPAKEELEKLKTKIKNGNFEYVTFIGGPADNSKEYNTPSGMVTDVKHNISSENYYHSWLALGLGIYMGNGCNMLLNDDNINYWLYRGWLELRSYLDQHPKLKIKIGTWNHIWLKYGLQENKILDTYSELDLTNFNIYLEQVLKSDNIDTKKLNWVSIIFALNKYAQSDMPAYVYNHGQTNTTVGLIPIINSEVTNMLNYQRLLVGDKFQRVDSQFNEANLLTSYFNRLNFITACSKGVLGVTSIEPMEIESKKDFEEKLKKK